MLPLQFAPRLTHVQMNEQGSKDQEEKKGGQHQAGFAERLVTSREAPGQRGEFREHEDAQTHPLSQHGVSWCDEFATNQKARDRQGETGQSDPNTPFCHAG